MTWAAGKAGDTQRSSGSGSQSWWRVVASGGRVISMKMALCPKSESVDGCYMLLQEEPLNLRGPFQPRT